MSDVVLNVKDPYVHSIHHGDKHYLVEDGRVTLPGHEIWWRDMLESGALEMAVDQPKPKGKDQAKDKGKGKDQSEAEG